MTSEGVLMKRCPRCSRWFGYAGYSDSFSHKCILASGSRLKSRFDVDHQGTRQLIKFDKEWWDQIGINPQQPWSRVTKRNFINVGRENIEVNTFIELG